MLIFNWLDVNAIRIYIYMNFSLNSRKWKNFFAENHERKTANIYTKIPLLWEYTIHWDWVKMMTVTVTMSLLLLLFLSPSSSLLLVRDHWETSTISVRGLSWCFVYFFIVIIIIIMKTFFVLCRNAKRFFLSSLCPIVSTCIVIVLSLCSVSLWWSSFSLCVCDLTGSEKKWTEQIIYNTKRRRGGKKVYKKKKKTYL